MKEFIDLQSAHVTQITSEKEGKGDWLVRQNMTSKDLYTLPSNLSDKDVFTILEFARKFELIAFNAGIEFGKDGNRKRLKLAINENEKLASVLDKLTNKEI